MCDLVEEPRFIRVKDSSGKISYGILHHIGDGIFLECKMLSDKLIPVEDVGDLIRINFLEDLRKQKSAITLH